MRRLFYIFCLLLVTACSYSSSQTVVLDEASDLIDSNPAEALSKLNSLDVSEFEDSATMARWALLYSEALVSNRLSAPTDTIVNIAIDYYRNHKLSDEFHKAIRLKEQIRATVGSDTLTSALYIQKEKEFLLYKAKVRHQQYMLGALILLFVATSIIVLLRQRLKIQSIRNEALMAEASGLKTQLDAGRGYVDCLEIRLHGQLENRFALIDSLCQTYYESQGTKNERKAIIDKVKDEIEAIRASAFPDMENAVNDCLDNILLKVKECIPGIKPDEHRLLVYLAAGLSARTISLLLNESVEVVYKRKSRLKARMKAAVAPGFPEIMKFF